MRRGSLIGRSLREVLFNGDTSPNTDREEMTGAARPAGERGLGCERKERSVFFRDRPSDAWGVDGGSSRKKGKAEDLDGKSGGQDFPIGRRGGF